MPTIQELESAFIKADDAAQQGDAQAQDDAAAFASEIKRMRAAGPEQPARAEWSELPGNIPSSAYNLAAGIYDTVRHPVKTLNTLSDAVGGATRKLDSYGFRPQWIRDGADYINDNLVPSFQQRPVYTPEELARQDATANAVGQGLNDRYGGWENIRNTMITDPVGAGLDIATIGTGTAALMGRGPLAASKAANVARIPGQTRASESLLRWSAPKPGALDKLGDEAMLLDASPSLTGMAQGVVAKPGPYSDMLIDALTTRHEGRSDRLLHGTQNTLGRLRDPVRLKTGIDKATQRASGPLYRGAKQNAPDLTGQLDDILARELTTPMNGMTQEGRMVMFKVMDDLDDALNAGDPKLTAQRLHDIRKNLDARIVYGEQAIQSLSSADKAAQAPLRKARAAVDKILKEKLPGFKQADAITATGKKAQDDVEFGYNSLEGGKTAMFPETFAMEYAKRDPKFVGEGMKSRIASALGTNANDTAALKRVVGDGNDFNRKKLVKTFGQSKTDDLVQAVDREQLFGQNFADIARNSQTAKRQAALKAIEGPDAPYIDQSATVTGLAARGVSKGLNALLARGLSKYSSKNSEALARALSLKGQDARDFTAELAKSKTPGDLRRKIAEAIVAVQASETVNRPHR